MNATQLAAYRRTVNAYVRLLLEHNSTQYMASVTPLYTAFGLPKESKSDADWQIVGRIQESFRRIAEQIARSRGWQGESWFQPGSTTPDTKTHVLSRTGQPRASQGHLEIGA